MPLVKSAYQKIYFYFLSQNIRCGYSKEPSLKDGSVEHPKHMFKRMDKKIFAILRSFFLSKPVHVEWPLAFIIKPFHSGHQ